ncbi:NAD(P)/FAD-dependent oxidoreductase [Streptomyces sp. NPDC058420]|uniref:NAD(P)/FAD-dependent oxidoreductase n=1 Tax=Streptomyces sp. NPDC058420 TaxID=3346489 RepID=UPI00364E3AC6
MTRPVVVAGGSVAGLACALALARHGFRVTVVERTPEPPSRGAREWRRPAVAQHGHSHLLTSLGVRVLREHAPEVLTAALDAGAGLLDLADTLPGGERLAEDAELTALAVRRPVFELALRDVVRALPGVEIRSRVTLRALTTAGRVTSAGRVTGVVTGTGEHLSAQAVVDATGRRAASRDWLAAAGAIPPAELTAPTAIRAFTRFYRLASPGALPGPLNRGNAAGGIWDHYAAVAHPADNGTYALTLGAPAHDRATAGLRDPAAFTAAARLSPHLAAWADPDVGRPIGPVRPITLPPNSLRPAAVVAGLYAVGDAACVTNPLYGRGMSLALRHAFALAGHLAETGEGDARAAARLADRIHRPWYEHSVREDAHRTALWRARVTGGPPPVWAAPDGRPALAEIGAAARTDPVVWRGLTRVLMGLDGAHEVLDDEVFRKRVRAAPAPRGGPRPPTRDELVRAVAAEIAP